MVVREINFKNDKGETIETELYINGRTVKQIEKELKTINPKYNFFNGLQMMGLGELTVILIFFGGFIHKKGNKNPVGSDWFDDVGIDVFEYFSEIKKALDACVEDTKPTNTGK